MKILLASSNPHKLDEIHAVWAELSNDKTAIELVGLDSLETTLREPVEDKPTFEGNAIVKAMYYAMGSGLWCIADDSGLEVDAPGGEPGVYSARYAGVEGDRDVVDPANNQRLLARLADTPTEKRTARFVCAMALCDPAQSDPLAVGRGTIEGRIIGANEDPRGENGFGYDPLFVVPDLGKTTAELSPDHKNRISHRGNASRLMWDELQRLT